MHMLRKIAIYVLSMTMLVGASLADSFDGPPKIVIKDNKGGMIGDFLAFRGFLERYGITVVFDGPCISACTILLTLPKETTCVTSNAQFLFHRAMHPNPEVEQAATDVVFVHYPEWVQNFIIEKGGLTKNFLIMKYADVKKYIRTC